MSDSHEDSSPSQTQFLALSPDKAVASLADFIRMCRDPQTTVEQLRKALPRAALDLIEPLNETQVSALHNTSLLEGPEEQVRANMLFLCEFTKAYRQEVIDSDVYLGE